MPIGVRIDAGATAHLLQSLASPTPASHWLAFLNGHVPTEFVSLVSYASDPPEQIEGHAWSVPNITAQCFQLYRERFYAADQVTAHARELAAAPHVEDRVWVSHARAVDLPSADWKRAIYDQHDLADRLSLLYAVVPGQVYALHMYRPTSQGALTGTQIRQITRLAPLLRQAHVTYLQVHGLTPSSQQRLLLQQATNTLALLSTREAQACRWLAQGYSAKEVARRMSVAPSTIATLRKRAYAKLKLHSLAQLRELFARL
jgi:DNA-binding CsgD family transcriptional regulator